MHNPLKALIFITQTIIGREQMCWYNLFSDLMKSQLSGLSDALTTAGV